MAFLAAHPGKVFHAQPDPGNLSGASRMPTAEAHEQHHRVRPRKIREKIEENPSRPQVPASPCGWATRWPTPWVRAAAAASGFRGATNLQKVNTVFTFAS